jgi:UrcA family protein
MATRKFINLTSAALLAAGTCGTAMAQSTPILDVPITKSVSYGDLDLTSKTGQDKFDQRIKAAVRSVCGEDSPRDMKSYELQQQCKMQAMRHAKKQSEKAIAQQTTSRRMAAANRVIVGN